MKATVNLSVSDSILHFFESRINLSGTTVIAAFSGGPDSAALLHGLRETRIRTGIELHAAYIDHGLRGQESSDLELAAVTRETGDLGVPLHIKRYPQEFIRREAEVLGKSIEDHAREKRYDFLQSTASALEARSVRKVYIAVGHHSDDFLETTVMAFIQGSGISGLTGIAEVNGRIIRPLLRAGKEKIREYLRQNKIKHLDDPSNADTDYFRNRVRHKIIPVLKEQYPGIIQSVFSGAEKAGLTESFIDDETRKTIKWNKPEKSVNKSYRTPLKKFAEASPIIKLRSLYLVYDNLMKGTGGEKRLPYRFIRPLIYLGKPEEFVLLLSGGLSGHGIRVRIEEDCLSVQLDRGEPGRTGYHVSITGRKTCNIGTFRIDIDDDPGSAWTGGAAFLTLPGSHPVITPPLPKDRITTARGDTPLRKMLSEQQIPPVLRDNIPVLRDEEGIAGVLSGPFGGADIFSNKITVQTPGNGYKMNSRMHIYIIKGSGDIPRKVIIQGNYAESESK
jgi:tRNA(Ile)-lysidine synthetase-like protein